MEHFMSLKDQALKYHSRGRPGKVEVIATKSLTSQHDLSLAYSPGVAEPCREIHQHPNSVYEYTAKGNLVAVVSNGTAVLGLGDIGPLASKPVMEGKANLFKRFADIDVFDIELDAKDPDEVIAAVRAIAPTFGGINLEDIKAPECFYIERNLQDLNIPVFHDDQHGTAIIGSAALLNACEITNRELKDIRVVFTGAGAAAVATATMLQTLGVQNHNIFMFDVHGLLYKGRDVDMFEEKEVFAQPTNSHSLTEALVGADVFIGLSVGNILSQDMLRSMNEKPIIFALANPVPEISYEDAKAAVPDAIIATGRSDFPNQVNNVLGFPFVFRGALDCRASKVTPEMKMAAVYALAQLAKEDVPESVRLAYEDHRLTFGPNYLIPKPFDPRVLLWVAPAVARAAMESGVAKKPIMDFEEYQIHLAQLMEQARIVIQPLVERARRNHRKIVFPDGENDKVLRAVERLIEERICLPILIGNPDRIALKKIDMNLSLEGVEIVDPVHCSENSEMVDAYWKLRQRKGMTQEGARRAMLDETVVASMLVHLDKAAGLLGGIATPYADTIRPSVEVLGLNPNVNLISGTYVMISKGRRFFFGDCTININPSATDLAQIAINTANVARTFGYEPRVAMLSFSDFGTHRDHEEVLRIREAIKLVRKQEPLLKIDGEMQADTAISEKFTNEYAFSDIAGTANVLIFPNLVSGNISYKLLSEIGGVTTIGPVLTGVSKPVNAIAMGASEAEVFNMAVITVNQVLDGERTVEDR
jgi:malate dehydrogenase (oxaloacetate-decarboxylating)(NADP+)